jgi:hypothetical protein
MRKAREGARESDRAGREAGGRESRVIGSRSRLAQFLAPFVDPPLELFASPIRARPVSRKEPVVNADDAAHGTACTLFRNAQHQDAYSFNGACTNWAEKLFARMRRAEIGRHGRGDNRGTSHCDRVRRLTGYAMGENCPWTSLVIGSGAQRS